jgi:two-component system, chemotaxis family, sensor kinase CheA
MSDESDLFLRIFLDEARDILDAWEKCVLEFNEDAPKSNIDSLFRSAHNLKGSSRSVGLTEFGAFVHGIEDLMSDIGQGKVGKTVQIRNILIDCHGILSQWIELLAQDSKSLMDTSDILQEIATIRGRSSDKSKDNEAFGLFDDPPPQPKVQEKQVVRTSSSDESGKNSRRDVSTVPDGEETIRIPSRKIDAIFRELSELSIQISAIEHLLQGASLSDDVRDSINKATNLVRNAQEEVLSLRMLPLGGLFQRLERVAIDVGRNLGKKIRLQTSGSEAKLDKFVIDQIKDPLIHILRNAIDHGVEAPEARMAVGKHEIGQVTLSAEQKSGSVELRISDDGRGLDESKIRKKALEKGLITDNDQLSPAEVRNLIFLPGFSTAEKVSDISGRGVGMDVVKTAITTLRGRVDIHSELGKGTSFVVSLPSTLSLFDVLIVECGEKQFAIPIVEVEEIVELSEIKVSSENERGRTIIHQGRVMPVVHLGSLLLNEVDPAVDWAGDNLALVGVGEYGRGAIAVERIIGQKTVVTRPLLGPLKNNPIFSGMTLLGNGEPCLILNVRLLISDMSKELQMGEVSHAI